MEGRLLLKSCSLFRSDGRIRPGMAITVEGGKITGIAPDREVPVRPGDWEVSCRGRLVAPGLIDCHAHLVGAQLLPTSGELLMRSSASRFSLQERLDHLLTASDVEVLTAAALARAARSGVTMIVDHLHCPSDVAGGLAAQMRSAERLGVRLLTSHATHSVVGEGAAEAQLEANIDFARTVKAHPLVRGALGFHASFMTDDGLLRKMGRAKADLGVGAVFHLAESEDDLRATYSRYGVRVVARLEAFGLLGPSSVAAHARAVDRAESERLAKTRTLVAISPRLDSISESAGSGLECLLAPNNLLGLASSGVGLLADELASAFSAALQVSRAGRLLDPDGLLAELLYAGPAELCSMVYGTRCGNIEAGHLADLVVYDFIPPTDGEAVVPSLLMQLLAAPVAWTVVEGRVVVREGKLLGCEYTELAQEAAKVLSSLWSRVGQGTHA